MARALMLILRPLLVSMAFSMVKAVLRAAFFAADKWMKKKVESTDNKYDDEAYRVFCEHREGILDALDRVVGLVQGKK